MRSRCLASVVGALVVSASGCGKTHNSATGDAGAGDAGLRANTCETSTDCSGGTSSLLPGTGSALGVDPLLQHPAQGNFHLSADSPAVDTADPAATLAVDFEGAPRPQGARRDMGAFERMK